MNIPTFKKKNTFQNRITESYQIMLKHPDKRPIICEKYQAQKNLPEIDKNKYLVPYNFTVGQFMHTIRERIKLKPEEALFLFINGHIVTCSSTIGDVYTNLKDADGFLYIQYAKENTFG